MANKSNKSGKNPGKGRASAKAKAKGKVSAKTMAKLQQQPDAVGKNPPQFVAGGGDTRAASAQFGAHMQKLMDQQG